MSLNFVASINFRSNNNLKKIIYQKCRKESSDNRTFEEREIFFKRNYLREIFRSFTRYMIYSSNLWKDIDKYTRTMSYYSDVSTAYFELMQQRFQPRYFLTCFFFVFLLFFFQAKSSKGYFEDFQVLRLSSSISNTQTRSKWTVCVQSYWQRHQNDVIWCRSGAPITNFERIQPSINTQKFYIREAHSTYNVTSFWRWKTKTVAFADVRVLSKLLETIKFAIFYWISNSTSSKRLCPTSSVQFQYKSEFSTNKS